ncbi:MAG: OsmC family peroxiredoxin [Spirochaetaceae bacterium]|nr:MAG: OsmC family peroxiredoxin [Spirochaetaceae bacterium]
MRVTLDRVNDKVHFVASNADGNTIHLDGSPTVGGEGAGFRPMEAVLAAIAGCASMDLGPILTKQRQRVDGVSIAVTGERADAVPAVFTSITVHYDLTGEIDADKARRAIELSVFKYCSVGAMLVDVDIRYSFSINGVSGGPPVGRA